MWDVYNSRTEKIHNKKLGKKIVGRLPMRSQGDVEDWDCQQITAIMLNIFCLLSKKNKPRVLNRLYQAAWNTYQD